MKTRDGPGGAQRPAVLLSEHPTWPERPAGGRWEHVEVLHVAE